MALPDLTEEQALWLVENAVRPAPYILPPGCKPFVVEEEEDDA